MVMLPDCDCLAASKRGKEGTDGPGGPLRLVDGLVTWGDIGGDPWWGWC